MQLNGKQLISYTERGDEAAFVLSGATLEEALALAEAPLVIEAGGKEVARFEGYAASSVALTGEYVTLRCVRKLDESTADAIHALEANVGTAKEQAADAMAAARAASDKADEAKAAADDAAGVAEQAANAANPELSTFAAMTLADMAPTMTDEQALSVPSLFAEWRVGADYEARQVVRYEGDLYRIAQKHTAADQYRPGAGTESLYTRIEVDPSGVEVWQQPTGAHDAYPKGAIVKDPADGEAYRSMRDGNVWGPPSEQPQFWEPVG